MSVANTRITPQVDNSKMVDLNFTVHKSISPALIEEIARALHSVGGFGSIEIYVQDHSVTQITVRNIKKIKHILAEWLERDASGTTFLKDREKTYWQTSN